MNAVRLEGHRSMHVRSVMTRASGLVAAAALLLIAGCGGPEPSGGDQAMTPDAAGLQLIAPSDLDGSWVELVPPLHGDRDRWMQELTSNPDLDPLTEEQAEEQVALRFDGMGDEVEVDGCAAVIRSHVTAETAGATRLEATDGSLVLEEEIADFGTTEEAAAAFEVSRRIDAAAVECGVEGLDVDDPSFPVDDRRRVIQELSHCAMADDCYSYSLSPSAPDPCTPEVDCVVLVMLRQGRHLALVGVIPGPGTGLTTTRALEVAALAVGADQAAA